MDIELQADGEPTRLHMTSQEWRACTEFDTPDWEPLEAVIPADQWGEFMWMYRVRPEGQGIEAYKHRLTRSYLHLDHTGRAWQWHPDGTWIQIPLDSAIAHALEATSYASPEAPRGYFIEAVNTP